MLLYDDLAWLGVKLPKASIQVAYYLDTYKKPEA